MSLFPDLVQSYLQDGILKKAIEKKIIQIELINPRDFVETRYKSADDRPFGGGDGMVLLPEPFYEAIKLAESNQKVKSAEPSTKIALTPQGQKLDDDLVNALSKNSSLILVCGRYAGFDQRFLNQIDMEISIGDFVLSGGELAALCLVEAVSRKLPGVLGDENSAKLDSFSDSNFGLLEGPSFTRPDIFMGQGVPNVLKSGHHKNILEWRLKVSLLITLLKREDLFIKAWPKVKTHSSELSKIKLVEFFNYLKASSEIHSIGISLPQIQELAEKLDRLIDE